MSFLLWQEQTDVGIACSRKVLRAAEVPLLADAHRLCERLQALHDDAEHRIETAREAARVAGHEEGFDRGVAEAQQILEERVVALATELSHAKQQLREQVATLALQVAHKLIGGLADDERLVALARTAIEALTPTADLTLCVHPDRVEPVQRRVDTWRAAAHDTPLPGLDVRADAQASPDTCRLETGFGSIDASLDTQLRRLAQAWGVPPAAVLESSGANAHH